MILSHTIPVTLTCEGIGASQLVEVQTQDDQGNIINVLERKRMIKYYTITRKVYSVDITHRVPNELRNKFINRGKLNSKAWNKYRKSNQEKVNYLNLIDHFWDCPEVHKMRNHGSLKFDYEL